MLDPLDPRSDPRSEPERLSPSDEVSDRRLFALLDSLNEAPPAGLVDRVFNVSVGHLPRPVEISSRSARELRVATLETAGVRGTLATLTWRRLGSALAMAAVLGFALLVAMPGVRPLLGPGEPPDRFVQQDPDPRSATHTDGDVEIVLASLLDDHAGSTSMAELLSPVSSASRSRLSSISDIREIDMNDLAEEFARIEQAASGDRGPLEPM